MNVFVEALIYIYSKLLLLYPRRFRSEFAEEMQIVFMDRIHEAMRNGILSCIVVCLYEFGGLPLSIVREVWHEFKRKEITMATHEEVEAASVGNGGTSNLDALVGALPFLIFGVTSLLSNIELPFHVAFVYIAFSAVPLIGLMIGLLRDVPRWTYSYLSWAVLMSMWWMMLSIDVFSTQYSPLLHNIRFGPLAWIPLLIVLGIARARSPQVLRQILTGIWQDWTLISLAFYTFGGFLFLLFDENHHPYLLAFIVATTLVIAASVWVYMRSRSTLERVLALLSGFVISYIIVRVSDATWDWATYYGLPPAQPEPWYVALRETIAVLAFWSAFMFWPVIIGLLRRAMNNRQKPGMST